MANTTVTGNIDIKDFQSLSSVDKLDNILLSLFGGGGAKISVELLTAVLIRTVKPTIIDDIWHIGGISTEVVANGKTPVLRTSTVGIEWQYEGDSTWQLLVSYDTLKMKFSDLTPDQIQILKLKLSDLTESEIAELQRPALQAAEKIGELEVVISDNEKSRVQKETARVASETARASAEASRSVTFTTLKSSSEQATDLANEVATHQSYVGEDNFVYQWNIVTKKFDKTDIYVKGDGGNSGVQLGGDVLDSTNFYIPDDVIDVNITAYEYAVKGGYRGTEAQFGAEQAVIAGNSARLSAVEQNKQDKPIAGRTFLTPLFVARGARFNDKTGFYELNGLTDITESQMMTIYNESSPCFSLPNLGELYYGSQMRTNFAPIKVTMGANIVGGLDCSAMFYTSARIEIIRFMWSVYPKLMHRMFMNCTKLKSIINDGQYFISLSATTSIVLAFSGCAVLENIRLANLWLSISFSDSPNLSLESIRYMINNPKNTAPITVTLHATAKARLTEEDIALAVSKNITIA